MKIRNKFILPVTVVVVVSVLIALFAVRSTIQDLVTTQQKSFDEYAQNTLAEKAQERKNSIYEGIAQFGKTALEEAAFFSQIPEVQQAYQLALSGNIDDEADPKAQEARDMLRRVMAPYIKGFKEQTGAKEFRLHFHLPNGRSLVRLWRDGWQTTRDGKKVDISDDISSFRATVMEINQGSHKPLTGIEVGRGGFVIRGLAAVTGPNGEHLGSCEVLLPFSDLLAANHLTDDYQIALYMISEMLPIAKKLQDPAKNPVVGGKYVFTSSTNADLTNGVVTAGLLDSGRNSEAQQVVGKQFVSSFPIPDYSGKVAGVMVLAYDMSKIDALTAQLGKHAEATINGTDLHFGIGSAILLAVVIGIIFLLTRIITAPLVRAVDITQKVSKGILNESLNHTSRDEVGVLSKALDQMIEGLKRKAGEAEQIAEGDLQHEE